jgi:tripartite-type tricarboxylate transporter receptor subunit TctC
MASIDAHCRPGRIRPILLLLRGVAGSIAIFSSLTVTCAEEPFKGKEITLHVGSGPGGAYDTYGRLLARHFGRHIPGNPKLIVSNMPGAAGRRMINFIYNVAPNDGRAIGTGLSTLAFDPLMGEASSFVAQKLTWIGSAHRETTACIVWHSSPFHSIEDAKTRTMAVGASGPSSTDSIYPNVLSHLFGMKFKVISGYASSPEMSLAIERGELDGRCGLTWSSLQSVNANWIKDRKVRILLQFALDRNPALKDVPTVLDLARNDEDRQILTLWAAPNTMGRPYFAPPGMASERTDMLRRAFDATMMDPAYIADAEQMGLGVDAITGEDVAKLVDRVYATPKAIVEKAAIAANIK